MLRKSLLIFSILCAAILIGCSKTENSNTAADNSNKSTASSGTTASGDKVGIPECDDFIVKYEACVSSKVPEMARAQYQGAIKTWRDSWKKTAADPATRGTLAAACKQLADQQAAALKSYGCAW